VSATESAAPGSSFTLEHEQHIASLDITLQDYVHNVTGARHLHLAADHSENAFLVAFKTVPEDSSGVAHILEHTVLCGSEKYPVRDPFFSMLRRSLNTYMNAYTTSDHTAYPLASQNLKDFNNLVDIYVDAVFFPTLDPLDFAQEGWRLEPENLDKPDSQLIYKGVVFNEMKGDNSSVISVLHEALKENLFPTNTYHFDSGGVPLDIPSLTYEQLKGFHTTHYHPSNAVFLSFGSLDVVALQDKLERQALHRFGRQGVRIEVPKERRYTAPIRAEQPFAVSANSDISSDNHLLIGWLLGESNDLKTRLTAHLLADAMLDTSASPLRKVLETTSLGKSPSPIYGIDDGYREMGFCCGLEGIKLDDVDAAEALILETLKEIAEEGIAEEQLEAVLHQLELHQREVGGDGYPYGLQLMSQCLGAVSHGGSPFEILDLEPPLAALREEIKDPEFVGKLIHEMLLDNPHRVTVVLRADPEHQERLTRQEEEQIRVIESQMDSADRKAVIDQAIKLRERQQSPDDLSLLPKVGLEDIPMSMNIPESEQSSVANRPVTHYEAATNGLLYHQVVTDMPNLTQDQYPALPIYSTLLTELGAGAKSYLTTQHQQHSYTGGVNAFIALRNGPDSLQRIHSHFTISAKALTRHIPELINILAEIAISARFDEMQRIQELIQQLRVRRDASITSNGHALAMTAASAGIAPVSSIHHQLSGLGGIQQLRIIDDQLQQGDFSLGQKLGELHNQLLSAPRQFLLVGDNQDRKSAERHLEEQWCDVQQTSGNSLDRLQHNTKPVCQLWLTNTQVNFCASAYPTVAEQHEDSAALTILAGVLRNGYLHSQLREQGGAYGGGASHDAANGVFRFYSYRDPRLWETFEVFASTVNWLLEKPLDETLVEEAILNVISGIDAPGSPSGEARQAFHNRLSGRGTEYRKTMRQRLIRVSGDDVRRVADQYLNKPSEHLAAVTHEGALQGNHESGKRFEIITLS